MRKMSPGCAASLVAWLVLFAGFLYVGKWTLRRELGDVFFLPIYEQKELYRDDKQEIRSTVHFRPGMFGRSFYQVWTRPTGEDIWTPVLTIEQWMDSKVGDPIVTHASGKVLLTDEKGTFEFDPEQMSFGKNEVPFDVYPGPFRCCDPPTDDPNYDYRAHQLD